MVTAQRWGVPLVCLWHIGGYSSGFCYKYYALLFLQGFPGKQPFENNLLSPQEVQDVAGDRCVQASGYSGHVPGREAKGIKTLGRDDIFY